MSPSTALATATPDVDASAPFPDAFAASPAEPPRADDAESRPASPAHASPPADHPHHVPATAAEPLPPALALSDILFTPEKPHRLVMVANRTGGQGKTLVAQLLLHLLAKRGSYATPMSADTRSETLGSLDKGERSKLAKVLHGTLEFGIGRSASSGGGSAEMLEFWDRMGVVFLKGPGVLDVGANVIDSIIDWAKNAGALADLAQELVVDLVVPVTCTPQPLADATSMIRSILTSKCLPIRNIYVVMNQWGRPNASDAAILSAITDLRETLYRPIGKGRDFPPCPSFTGDIGLLVLPSLDTTTSSTILGSFERNEWFVGAADVPLGNTPLDRVSFEFPLEEGGAIEGMTMLERSVACRAKFQTDAAAIWHAISRLNVFSRGREKAALLNWIRTFEDNLQTIGFFEEIPLVAQGGPSPRYSLSRDVTPPPQSEQPHQEPL